MEGARKGRATTAVGAVPVGHLTQAASAARTGRAMMVVSAARTGRITLAAGAARAEHKTQAAFVDKSAWGMPGTSLTKSGCERRYDHHRVEADRPLRNPAGHPEPLLEPVDRALREVALRVAPHVEGLVCGSVGRVLPAGPCARG